tara:strand:- start:130 stop:594 length:465 start_codon:yes stop_codon:yes gene_type:complete
MNKKIVLLENNVPLDFRYRVTQKIVDQMRFLRMLEYSLQKIVDFIYDTRGVKICTTTVSYWTSESRRKKQLVNNEKQKKKIRARETAVEKKARIKKQSKYRVLNWKRDPRLRLKHDIQSAKDETRSTRKTVQGLDIKKANALKPLLHTPNRKVV